MDCPNCGTANTTNHKFCNECGERLTPAAGAGFTLSTPADDARVRDLLNSAREAIGRSEWNDAVFACQGALALAPDSGEAHVLLGSVYERMGRDNDAVQQYRLGLRLDSGNLAARAALERLEPPEPTVTGGSVSRVAGFAAAGSAAVVLAVGVGIWMARVNQATAGRPTRTLAPVTQANGSNFSIGQPAPAPIAPTTTPLATAPTFSSRSGSRPAPLLPGGGVSFPPLGQTPQAIVPRAAPPAAPAAPQGVAPAAPGAVIPLAPVPNGNQLPPGAIPVVGAPVPQVPGPVPSAPPQLQPQTPAPPSSRPPVVPSVQQPQGPRDSFISIQPLNRGSAPQRVTPQNNPQPANNPQPPSLRVSIEPTAAGGALNDAQALFRRGQQLAVRGDFRTARQELNRARRAAQSIVAGGGAEAVEARGLLQQIDAVLRGLNG